MSKCKKCGQILLVDGDECEECRTKSPVKVIFIWTATVDFRSTIEVPKELMENGDEYKKEQYIYDNFNWDSCPVEDDIDYIDDPRIEKIETVEE